MQIPTILFAIIRLQARQLKWHALLLKRWAWTTLLERARGARAGWGQIESNFGIDVFERHADNFVVDSKCFLVANLDRALLGHQPKDTSSSVRIHVVSECESESDALGDDASQQFARVPLN